jgi:hypothetical protein
VAGNTKTTNRNDPVAPVRPVLEAADAINKSAVTTLERDR